MKLKCPDCGTQFESGKFCLECGAKLQEVAPELVCPSCGHKTKSGKFCPECGTKLSEQPECTKEGPTTIPEDRKFNEKDPRLSKYYNKKGFPRTIPQEEKAIAIEELTSLVEEGNAEAKMLLGGILCSCSDNESIYKAITLLSEAEQSGDKLAYFLMGMLYFYGCGDLVKQNHNEAEKRMLELDRDFSGAGTPLLAELYAFSREKCDYKKAFEYATVAAENDEKAGYFILATLYFNGWGVNANTQIALDNYMMAAAQGDETSMNQIGFIYMGESEIEANPEQSFYWFSEAAKKDSDVGMYNLGFCYKNGFGVKEDAEKATECFKKAAELGYIDAMIELGEYYQSVLIDNSKAKMWYLKAAELGNAEAQNCLGVLYADDINPNYSEAIKWYQKAMEQNNPNAYRNYAMCLWNGDGVDADKDHAIELMRTAITLGHPSAKSELSEMQEMKAQENNPNELHIPEGTKILTELIAPNNSDENWRLNITSIFLPKSLCDIYIEFILEEELPNLQKIVIPNGEFDKFANMLPDDWWRMYYEDGSFVCPEITIPQEDLWTWHYGITNFTSQMGSNAKGHVLIPPTCTSISKSAFSFNKEVLSITMTDSVTSIDKEAFYGCKNLSFIRLSNNLKEIPASMLSNCDSLQEVSVPEGVTSIGKAAFCSCKSLKTITLPTTVHTIDKGGALSFNPFKLCDSLQQIIVPAGTKGKYQIILDGFSSNPARLLKEAPMKVE